MSEAPKLVWDRDRKFASIPWEEIKPTQASWLIKGVLPRKGTGFMVGASKAGKTFVALDWAFKIAAGATVMGRKARQVGVAYLAAEDPTGCALRIEAIKKRRPRESYTPFRLISARVNLLDPDDRSALLVELREIDAEFQAHGHRLGLVVFDTLSRSIPGAEENSSASMSLAVEALDDVGRETDALVLALAHHGKSGTQGGIRGSSVLDAASDATITIERGDPDKDEDPNLRTVTLSKVKNGKDGDKVAFRLERQDLGLFDEDGDEMWSCYVQYDYAAIPPPKRQKQRPEDKAGPKIVLRAFHQLLEVGPTYVVPPVPGVPPGAVGIMRTDLRARAISIGHPSADLKEESAKRMTNKDISELISAGVLRQEGEVIWKVRR